MHKRSRLGAAASVAALIAALLGGFRMASAGEVDPMNFTAVDRGRYLSILSDCASCHTVPQKNEPFAGGRPIETPFGSIVAPNITPDFETGIGSWTDDQFDNAIRKGVGRNGERLYPAMPFNAYTKMSREDVLAIRAYLNTVTAVYNPVVANMLPFPFNIRTSMRIWDGLYFKVGEYVSDPHKSAEWNRGAFLVDGPAHCGACHTPKSFLGGDKTAQYLQGSPLQAWSAPNITNDARTGLGGWSVEDVAAYLKTGHNRITAATGPMAEAVDLSTSKMTDEDVKAIATYLKSLPGDDKPQTAMAASTPEMAAGGAIYREVLGLPWPRRQGHRSAVSVGCELHDGTGRRSDICYPDRAAGRPQRGDGQGADRAGHAVLRLAAEGRPGRERHNLHPQLLGQRRARGVSRRRRPPPGVRRQAFRLRGGQGGFPDTLGRSLRSAPSSGRIRKGGLWSAEWRVQEPNWGTSTPRIS
jgi:mono/diheme cytochrome c family protein